MIRRSFPFPSGGGGALSVRVIRDPLETYTESSSASRTQTAVIEGGTTPYIASWTRVSGSTGIGIIPGTTQCTFTASADLSRPVSAKSGVFQVEVTDAAYQTASVQFTVTFYFGLEEP